MSSLNAPRRILQGLLDKLGWAGPLLARITIGWVFVFAGWGKLQNLPKIVDYFASLGIPAPQIQAPFVAGVEVVCGLAVALGIFTRVAAFMLIGTMVVALITAIAPEIHSFDDLTGKIEFLYGVILVMLVVHGAGAVSIDRLIFGAPAIPERR